MRVADIRGGLARFAVLFGVLAGLVVVSSIPTFAAMASYASHGRVSAAILVASVAVLPPLYQVVAAFVAWAGYSRRSPAWAWQVVRDAHLVGGYVRRVRWRAMWSVSAAAIVALMYAKDGRDVVFTAMLAMAMLVYFGASASTRLARRDYYLNAVLDEEGREHALRWRERLPGGWDHHERVSWGRAFVQRWVALSWGPEIGLVRYRMRYSHVVFLCGVVAVLLLSVILWMASSSHPVLFGALVLSSLLWWGGVAYVARSWSDSRLLSPVRLQPRLEES